MQSAFKVVPYYDEHGFDAIICDDQKRLYAVFDGMGTAEDARFASGGAVKHFQELPSPPASFHVLKHELEKYQNTIRSLITGTTATMVCVDSAYNLHYVHCGDSRLYVTKGSRVKQITADEGVENILYNYIGLNGKGVSQLGTIGRNDWDKLLLCSDGITGDRFPDLLEDTLIEDILKASQMPDDAVDLAIKVSTKKDDKSIVVVYKTDIHG